MVSRLKVKLVDLRQIMALNLGKHKTLMRAKTICKIRYRYKARVLRIRDKSGYEDRRNPQIGRLRSPLRLPPSVRAEIILR